MVRWLHISDLHIKEKADWYSYRNEIVEKCNEIGKIDFIIVTGDFMISQKEQIFIPQKSF